MPLPLALMGGTALTRILPRLMGSRAGLIGMSGAAGGIGSMFGGFGGSDPTRKRRRRPRTLTKGQMSDLTFIAHHIGKTAAGEYLHFIR